MISDEHKAGYTTAVANFEAAPAEVRARNGGSAMSYLESVAPANRWHDEGPLWAQLLGVGWWDTWPNLRSRVIAARNSAAIETGRAAPGAAPESVAGAAVGGALEGLGDGAAALAEPLGNIVDVAASAVKNADKLLLVGLALAGLWLASKGIK